jgi:hypothetical protein
MARDPIFGDPGGIQLVTAMIRRDVLNELNGFDASYRYAEDRRRTRCCDRCVRSSNASAGTNASLTSLVERSTCRVFRGSGAHFVSMWCHSLFRPNVNGVVSVEGSHSPQQRRPP